MKNTTTLATALYEATENYHNATGATSDLHLRACNINHKHQQGNATHADACEALAKFRAMAKLATTYKQEVKRLRDAIEQGDGNTIIPSRYEASTTYLIQKLKGQTVNHIELQRDIDITKLLETINQVHRLLQGSGFANEFDMDAINALGFDLYTTGQPGEVYTLDGGDIFELLSGDDYGAGDRFAEFVQHARHTTQV